jgi:hypothetical protein
MPAAVSPPHRSSRAAGIVLAAALALALYLDLAPPALGPGDASEFTLALAFAGATHPPGYPLYVLLGHAFVVALHALGIGWAYAANAWSAVGGAVTVAFALAIAHDLMPGESRPDRTARTSAMAAAGVVVGLSPLALRDGSIAEVQAWHAAWVAAAAWSALRLLRRVGDAAPSARDALAWGVVCGIGLAHHRTSLLFVVPLSFAIVLRIVRARAWRTALVAWATAGAAVPLACYGLVFFRAVRPAAYQWPLLEPDTASLVRYLTASVYRLYFGRFAPAPDEARLIATSMVPVLVTGLPLLALFVPRAPARDRHWIVALLVAATLQLAFTTVYGVPDPSSMFRPALIVAALAVPVCVAALPARARVAAAVAICVLALAPVPMALREARASRLRIIQAEARTRTLFRGLPPGRAIVLWINDRWSMLRAFQLLERVRPELYVENPTMLTWPAPRERFRRAMGFDPMAGLKVETPDDLAKIPWNIQAQTKLTVIDFDVRSP